MARRRGSMHEQTRARALRIPILIAAFTLVAAWALLQGQAKVLESMAPPGCTASGPAALQGGLGAAPHHDAVEVVTGWHAFTRASHGDAPAPMYLPTTTAAGCGSTPRAAMENVLGTLNADTTARVWLITDMVLFAPAYAVLLLLVLAWVRVQQLDPVPTGHVRPELPVLRGAIWLARRRWVMSALVVTGLLADWGENTLLLRRLSTWWSILDRTGALRTADLHLGLVRTASVVKWLALVAPLLVALLFSLRQLVRAVALAWRALPRLWVQAALVTVFAALVLVPDQGADALRRLSVWQWGSTLLVIALFVVVIVCSAGEVLKPKDPTDVPVPPASPSPGGARGALVRAIVAARWGAAVTAMGAGIFLVSRLTGFRGLIVPAAVVAVIGVVSMVLDAVDDLGDLIPGIVRPDVAAATEASRVAAAMPAAEQRDAAVARVAPCLAGVIVGSIGFATLRASAGDLALLGGGPGNRLLMRVVVGFVATVSTGMVVLAARRLLRLAAAWTDRRRVMVLVGLVAVHAPAVAFHDPDLNLAAAAALGTFSLLAVFLSGFSLIGSVAARASNVLMRRRHLAPIVLPSALRMLRLRSTPITGLLVVWALLVPMVDNPSYHAVRQWPGAPAAPVTVEAYVARWQTDTPHPTTGASPALLVAASGGGIRAAYWTAAVLDCIVERTGGTDDPCGADATDSTVAARRRTVLAMSGISGGSLGLAEYVTAVGMQWDPAAATAALPGTWYRSRLGADFLSPTIAGWLFNDGANALLRPDEGVDRAAVMERAWERTWPHDELSAPFFTDQRTGHQPALLLNGFSVDDGCRVLTSPLATQPDRTAADCTRVSTDGSAPAVLSTVDLGAQLCPDRDIGYSTAALASARFPLVSPAGHLGSCAGAGSPIDIVDGGYRETSGASTLVELWPELQAALGSAPQRCVSPVFLQIDNGYASDQVSGVARGAVGQVLAPLRAVLSSSAGEEAAAREASRQLFDGSDGPGTWFRITTYAHPGSTAPLGWVLSSDAMNDLERQLVVNAPTIIAIRDLLDHPPPCG